MAVAGGVSARVKVAPKAARDAILGITTGADGRAVIRLSVRAAPEGGKANASVTALLANAWGVPKSRVTVVRGEKARTKTVLIEGEPRALGERLAAWKETLDG